MKYFNLLLAVGMLAAASGAYAGPGEKARDAIDPDCTPAKAAKGAAQRAAVGVGNRCDVKETARDVTGTDDRDKNGLLKKDDKKDGVLKRD